MVPPVFAFEDFKFKDADIQIVLQAIAQKAILETDEDGNEIWIKTYGGQYFDVGRGVQETSDGGYILAGKKYGGSGPLFEHYCLLIKTDSNGNKEWELIYGKHYVYHDGFSSVLQSNDGGYVAAGRDSIRWGSTLPRREIPNLDRIIMLSSLGDVG